MSALIYMSGGLWASTASPFATERLDRAGASSRKRAGRFVRIWN